MSHPVQNRVITILADAPGASAQEIAALMDAPVDSIRFQLRRLREAGLVEAAEARARRGVTEHYYRVLTTPSLSVEDLREISNSKKVRIATEILKGITADVSRALAARTFIAREEAHLSRVAAPVDAVGWRELAAIHERALEEVERVKLQSGERLRESGGKPIEAVSALICFERPAA
jgi:predicted ArsR family transcriptional regulator